MRIWSEGRGRRAILTSTGLSGFLVCALLAAQPVSAQEIRAEEPSREAQAEGDPTVVDEIIVTALKTGTSVQQTPATVQVIDKTAMRDAGINSIAQIGSVAPGVIIQRPPNNTANASIRGLGTSPGPVSFDQGVALFIDGIYAARGSDFLSSLFDLERIEIVKGTQAAVLGKNTSLGALSLTARGPGRAFSGNFLSSYEFERGSDVYSGAVDLPISDQWAVRIAAQHQDLGGIMKNLVTLPGAEREAQQTRDDAVRVTSSWQPTDGLRLTSSYSHSETSNIGTLAEMVVGSPAAQALFEASGFGSLYETSFDLRYARFNAGKPAGLDQKTDRVVNKVEYELGSATITALTGWSQFDQDRRIDYDGSPGTYALDVAQIAGEQFSQEIRIASQNSGRFGYLAGILYLDNSLSQQQTQATFFPTGNTGEYTADFQQDTQTWSGFGQLSYDLSSAVTLSGGLRVTDEKKSVEMARHTVVPGFFSTVIYPAYARTRLSRSETVVDGSVTIQYRPTDGLMIYASAAQGTKGGGFTDFALPANAAYDKEVAHTEEVGIKLEGQDRLWHLNAAVFDTRVDDFQNNFFNGVTFVVQNLDIRSRGLELDALWQVAPGFRLFADATFANAINEDAVPGVGDRLPRSPRFAGRAGFNYQHDLNEAFQLRLATNLTYRSRISHQLNPDAVPYGRPYGALNVTVGLTSLESGWDLSLIGRNLNDARSFAFAYPTPNLPGSVTAAPEETRTVTVQLRYDF